MNDLLELLQIVWEDFKASDDLYIGRLVFFSVLVIMVITVVRLVVYAA